MATDYLLPTQNGFYSQLIEYGVTEYWQLLDDPVASPDTTTYISNGFGGVGRESVILDAFNPTLSADQVVGINSITITTRVSSSALGSTTFKLFFRMGSTDYDGSDRTANSTTWTDFSQTWTTNPATGKKWSIAQLAALQVGVYVTASTALGTHYTQLYVTINYTIYTGVGAVTLESSNTLIIQSVDASADRGGWQVTASFANDMDEAEYGRRVDIFIHGEGNGVWEEDKKAIIHGNMIPQNVSFTRRQSDTPVIISTSDVFLQNAGHQGIYFTNTTPSTNPHQIPGLNLGKIVEHIIEQHTNISISTAGGWVDTSGIDTINSTSVDVYTVRQSNSIWSTIQNIASNEFYVRYFTKDDRMIYERHPQFAAILPSPTLLVTQNMIVETPEITYRNELKTDQVLLYALRDNGAILTAKYPDNVGTELSRQKFTNLRCNSQARLNVLAERAYKYLNRQINLRVAIAGAWAAYLELYDRISVTYSGTTRNGVTVAWSQKKFWINAIRVNRVGSFGAITELDLEEENV